GVREEFKLDDARYHKVILMTDADVDGAHIRTLVLTFLYREMQDLIEAGYVYIAKPPLYKVRNGSEELYVEKEGGLEDFLLRDKIEQYEVIDSKGKSTKLSKRRWQSFNRKLKEYEGWSSSLQAEYGHDLVNFLSESQILDAGAATLAGVKKLVQAKDPKAEPFETKLVKGTKDQLVVKATHRRSGLARTHTLPAELFKSNEYRKLVEVHGGLLREVGRPPFKVTLDARDDEAVTFSGLRRAVLDLGR